jgi:hypothetical protein
MEFISKNLLLLIPILVIQLFLLIAGAVDLAKRDRTQVRGGLKWPWVIVLLINIIGPLVYFVFGRKD